MAGKIIANIDRLNRLMDENGCSAVVARFGKISPIWRGSPIRGPWPGIWISQTPPEESG